MWILKTKVFIPAVVVMVIVIFAGLYLYNKPHRNIVKAKATYSISSQDLFSQFEDSTAIAVKKYTGKVIEITGSIQTVDISDKFATIILAKEGDFYGVNCSFNPVHFAGLKSLVVGELVTIKGECKGYIDDVILNNCILVK